MLEKGIPSQNHILFNLLYIFNPHYMHHSLFPSHKQGKSNKLQQSCITYRWRSNSRCSKEHFSSSSRLIFELFLILTVHGPGCGRAVSYHAARAAGLLALYLLVSHQGETAVPHSHVSAAGDQTANQVSGVALGNLQFLVLPS